MKKFELGTTLATTGVDSRMKEDPGFMGFVKTSLGRYVNCDWGDTCDDDKLINDEAVEIGETRILAVYIRKSTGEKIWIITESDRSATTILFPEEY